VTIVSARPDSKDRSSAASPSSENGIADPRARTKARRRMCGVGSICDDRLDSVAPFDPHRAHSLTEAGRVRLQDVVTPIWRRIAANCHPNRATLAILRDAGFDFDERERLAIGAPWTRPVVAGYATLRPPSAH
jgi:hypothetical protein